MDDNERCTECRSSLATRPILYTDGLKGEQVCRDDLWAVTTEELNRVQDNLQKLGARLTALLDEDQWAECEALLLAAGVRPNVELSSRPTPNDKKGTEP